MRRPGGALKDRVRGKRVVITWLVVLLGWALVGGASAGTPKSQRARADQLEALAFDPFRLVTERELLAVYEAALKPAAAAVNGQSGQPVSSSTAPALAPSARNGGEPVGSSTTASITSLTSAAALLKAFVGQALLIAPRPPLRTPTQPTWP